MKTINQLSTRTMIKAVTILSVLAIPVIMLNSCGKNKFSEKPLSEGTEITDNRAFTEVDEMPVYPGGDAELLNFVLRNVKYPEEAKAKNITGRVLVKFVVEKDCSVSGIEVEKGVDPLLDAEAVRVVGTIPKFEKPAKKAGETVRVQFMLPITFALQ